MLGDPLCKHQQQQQRAQLDEIRYGWDLDRYV
jgi:hypothetical protein